MTGPRSGWGFGEAGAVKRVSRAGAASAVAIALVTVLLPAGVLAARSVSIANREDTKPREVVRG